MKNFKFSYLLVLFLVFNLIFAGCSSNKNESATEEVQNSAPDMATDSGSVAPQPEMEGIDYISDPKSIEPDKIITTVSIYMQTKDFMPTVEKLNSLIEKHKGYIETSNISYNNYVYSSALKRSEYTIRIPRENLSNFKKELTEIGNIISENTSKMDITKQYRDTQSRLKVLETKEARILALLEKAEKMEDIIALENQLSTIIYDKENLTANIMNMDDSVNYSTVNFQLEEVAKLSSGDNIKTPFGTRVMNALKESAYYAGRFFEDAVIALIYFFPYGIVISIIGYLVLKIIRRRKNKSIKKDINKEQPPQ